MTILSAATATAAIALLLMPHTAFSYTTNTPNHLPRARHSQWLKQMTQEICDQPTGQLSDETVQSLPRIMKGWTKSSSDITITPNNNSNTRNNNNNNNMRPKNHQYHNHNSNRRSTESAVAVEQLLKRVIDERAAGNAKAVATTDEYNCLLESWAKSGAGAFAAERCEMIVKEMERLYHQNGDLNVQPNLASFKTVLMAWRHSNVKDQSVAALRAQRVLEWMVSLHEQGKNEQALPDSDCFDIVLQIWSHSGSTEVDAPMHAERLLGAMERLYRETGSKKLSPKVTSFNAVLAAWTRSKSEHASTRSIEILGFMDHLHLNEGNEQVKPDAYTYGTVMNTLGRKADKAAASKSEMILRTIEKEYRAGSLSWTTDTALYNSAINCWSKSDVPGAFRHARSILDRQVNYYQKYKGGENAIPDVFGFTSVISSCASECGGKDLRNKAFETATRTFVDLQRRKHEFGAPNHVTYGTMMKACVRLLPVHSPKRKKWVKKIFDESIKQGQVGDMVLSRLREATTAAEYKKLMRGHSKQNIPKSWNACVSEKSGDYQRNVQRRRTGEV